MKQRDTQAFLTMQSKSKHQCKLCSRSYVSKQNLIRHVKAKHPGCNTLALIFKCSSCEDIFDNMDTFQTHCAVDSIQTRTTSEGNPAVENISREGTPVTTEFEQGEGLTYSGQWTRGRQKKRWEDNIKEWTGMDFASSTRAAENRSRWKGVVANSSVVPRRPSNVMG